MYALLEITDFDFTMQMPKYMQNICTFCNWQLFNKTFEIGIHWVHKKPFACFKIDILYVLVQMRFCVCTNAIDIEFLSSGLGASMSYFIGQSVGLSKKYQKVSKHVKNCQKRSFKTTKVSTSVQIYFTGLWQALLLLESVKNIEKFN